MDLCELSLVGSLVIVCAFDFYQDKPHKIRSLICYHNFHFHSSYIKKINEKQLTYMYVYILVLGENSSPDILLD